MSCYIDNVAGEEYIANILQLMPETKKSRFCAQCLAEHPEPMNHITCAYYQHLESSPDRPVNWLVGNTFVRIVNDTLVVEQLETS